MNALWTGKAKKLDDVDLPRIGHRIGVGEDELHAVLDVETRGGGFDGKGRIKMLFEPHIFYRQLGPVDQLQAVRMRVAYKDWGTRPYPADSFANLITAMNINREAALRSASWGLGQIMGFNCSVVGYDTAEAMVKAFRDDEEVHLEAMVRFIEESGIDDELRRHDWAGFARIYNGPSYAKHGYHTKLAARFKWWQGKPDTKWSPDREMPDVNACFGASA